MSTVSELTLTKAYDGYVEFHSGIGLSCNGKDPINRNSQNFPRSIRE